MNKLLNTTLNTRDLGGYPTSCGGTTSYKRFLRSDAPYKLSDRDKDFLISNNITTIVDLRSDDEAQNKPCILNNKFQYHHCKLYGDGYVPSSTETVPYSYFEIVNEQKSILSVMKIFANSKSGVLYHCTAGKDRTGVISALLLLLAGVSTPYIIDDYMISEVYLRTILEEFCRTNKNVDINIITPKREYMEKFLDLFHQKYKSVKEYFFQIGLTESEISGLEMKLISM